MVAESTPARAHVSVGRLARAAVVAALCAGTLGACSDAVLSVDDTKVETSQGAADAAVSAAGAGSTSSPASATGSTDAALEVTPAPVGAFSLRLPLGWTVWTDAAAAGDGATVGGAGTYTVVPAEGKDQSAWITAIRSGATTVVEEREGLVEEQPVTLADGRQAFHLVHSYSENRAHLYGVVDGDQLHMLRFGLDGSPEAAAVVAAAVATASLAPAAMPTPTAPAATLN